MARAPVFLEKSRPALLIKNGFKQKAVLSSAKKRPFSQKRRLVKNEVSLRTRRKHARTSTRVSLKNEGQKNRYRPIVFWVRLPAPGSEL